MSIALAISTNAFWFGIFFIWLHCLNALQLVFHAKTIGGTSDSAARGLAILVFRVVACGHGRLSCNRD